MGGARPKTTVEADQALWLAKFPAPSETWNQPRVEHGLLLQRCCSKFSGNSVPSPTSVNVSIGGLALEGLSNASSWSADQPL
jgi:hypothetical protein